MTTMLSVIVAALLVGTAARAQVRAQDTTGEIDAIFGWATPASPGCAVAVSRHGELVVNRAYGLADLDRAVPIGPDTRFDVGSVTKQFVAAAVLLLVEEGRISLSDDVRTYFPELPDYGRAITLDHLLTHTGGLRDWVPLVQLSSDDQDALTMILRQRGLDFAPGEEWSYSNSGYVLLKELVARTTGMSFSDFARGRLFEPLGMGTTTYADDPQGGHENLALAYEREGDRWEQDVLLGNERGGGGALISTAGDLLIWNDALTSARLGAFVTEKLQQPARLNNGRQLGYARGLYLDSNRGGRVVWHSGSAAAYNSLLTRFPEQGLSIAILCNAGDIAETTVFARRIFDLFVPATGAGSAEAGAPAAVAQGAGAAGADPNSTAGLFFSERTGEPLCLIVENGRLRFAGGPALVQLTKGGFRTTGSSLSFMSQGEFELHFLSDDLFELTSKEGETTTYRRARPYAPTLADLEAFAGRYESEEIGAVFGIAAGERGLIVRLTHAPAMNLEIRPVAPDTFQAGPITVRFHRDEGGNVVGLGFSSPVLRDVKFTRLNDRTSPE